MLRATLAAYSASEATAVAPASQGSAVRTLTGGGSGTAPLLLLLLLLLGRGSSSRGAKRANREARALDSMPRRPPVGLPSCAVKRGEGNEL